MFDREPKRKLRHEVRGCGQTRAGYVRGSQFVFSQHCKSCRDVGFSEEQIEALPHWHVADCFSDVERAVLAYTDEMVMDNGRVSDGTFAALKKHLSDVEILELTYITAMYEMHAIMSRALRLEYDDVDERVVEVPMPPGNDGEGDGSSDVMSMVDTDK